MAHAPRARAPPRAGADASSAHGENAESQRGVNGQPTISRSSRGGAPGIETHVLVAEQVGRRREQHARVRVTRIVVDRRHLPHLDDLARVHHRRAVADLRHHRQVVRDQDHRQAQIAGQAHQEIQDLGLHHHVERGRRLVGEQDLRLARQRERDRRALAHAARELVRIPIGAVARDPDQLEQLAHLRPGRPARSQCRAAPSARRSARRSVLTGLKAFIAPWNTIAMSLQRCGADRFLALGEHVLAVQVDAAGDACARRQEPHQRQDGGRLAASRLSHEAHPLAGSQLEADALDGVQLAAAGQVEPDVQVLGPENGLARSLGCPAVRAAAADGTGAPPGGRPCRRGLSASSMDCPTIVQARMRIVTATPGGTIAHQALLSTALPRKLFSISLPHEIVLGSPRPRKVM